MPQKGKSTSKKSLLEKLLSWGVVGVFLVLPILYFPGRIASYVTSKEYFLIGSVDLLAVIWIGLLLRDRRYRLTRKNFLFLVPLLLFLLSLTVSAIVGVDRATSFFSTVESGTGLLLLYHVFLFTCIITSLIRVQQKTFLKHILQANLFASVILASATFFTGPAGLIELNSKMLDGSSGGAMMGNSLLVGAYFIFSVFLTLYLLFHESRGWKKGLYWLGLAVMIFSPVYFNVAIFKGVKLSSSYFFFGEARIAVVALLIGLLLSFCMWLYLRKQNGIVRVLGIVGIVALLIAGVVGIQQVSVPTSSTHTFFIAQSGNRITDWQEAIQGIKARPLLGWGPENYHAVYQQYLNPIVFNPGHGNEVWALHPHNNTFEVLINGGIIGFVLYLLVLVSLFSGLSILYRKRRIDAGTYALFAGMMAAFIIQQQMIYDSIVSYMMFFFIIAIIAGLYDETNESAQAYSHWRAQAYGGVIAAIIVLFPLWFYAAYLPARKMEEMQWISIAHSDQRTLLYQHLFHSPGA